MEEMTLQQLFVIGLQFEASFQTLGKISISKSAPNETSVSIAANVPTIPAIVCGAFALELQLKCLIAIETGNRPPRSHNLRQLFEQTTAYSQESIRNKYAQLLDEAPGWTTAYAEYGISLNFDDVLNSSKDAFVEWRYHYEFEKSKSWAAAPIIKAVRDEWHLNLSQLYAA